MSEISTRIRKYLNNPEVNDPEVTKHYGRWCMFNRDQRRQIRELCNTCDMFEKTADSFWQEMERLKAEIERLQKSYADYEETTGLKQAKAEAIKEFAERLKSKHRRILDYDEAGFVATTNIVYVETIDNLVKEFTEGEKQ